MSRPFKGLYSKRSLVFKLTGAFLLVILLPMLLMAFISTSVIGTILENKTQQRLSIGLKAAMSEYYARGEQMRYGMLQAATSMSVRKAILKKDTVYLRGRMAEWKRSRPYVDIWTVVDTDGHVIARYNSDNTGDVVGLNGLVDKAISTGEALISTELISKSKLLRDGFNLSGRGGMAAVSGSADIGSTGGNGRIAGEVMALSVVTPVLNKGRKPIGAIITVDVLNKDDHVPDTIASKIPGLFTTISMGEVRISTNIVGKDAQSLHGSVLPKNVASGVRVGSTVVSEWSFNDRVFMSMSEPIRNNSAEVIGSLGVGIDKDSLWVIQRKSQEIIAGTTLLGLILSLFVAYLTANKITRPVKQLADKLDRFAAGDMNVQVDVGRFDESFDEVTRLSSSFNSMMNGSVERERDRALYLKEIEGNNKTFVVLNEELVKKNEEVELAYEETQSQAEELHSVNEELKLLNEDLDSKNVELRQANRTILSEEQELKRAKDKLRLIFDSIKDYVLVVDADLTIYEANRQFVDDFNLDMYLVSGSSLKAYFGAGCSADDFPILQSFKDMHPFGMEYSLPGGKVYDIHTYPFIDSGGEKRSVLYIKDITEEKIFLEKLVHTDKLSSLGELVSGVAHELNNPLTGIMCFSEILLGEGLETDTSAKVQKIRDASERCKKIIENLLTFARVQQPEKKYSDINKVVLDSVELRSYQLKVDNVSIELNLDSNLPRTMVDVNQLEQVFLNLLNNARDSILDESGSGTVKLSTRACGSRVIIRFEDNGTGITDEVAGKLFDPFFTTKEVGKGTGLGLSISYGIIQEHGGEITVSSALSGGAVFTISLPVIESTVESDKFGKVSLKSDNVVKKFPKGLRALVLDDEPLLLDILEQSLSSFGFHVEKSGGVTEALEKLVDHKFDLVVSDVKMPGLDGTDFYKEVSNLYPYLLDRMIFISGDAIDHKTRSFLKSSAQFFLKKPFTVEELGNLVFRLVT